MVCIYCGSATRVTNSRPQRRLHQTWRRRLCSQCQAIFTTIESVDFNTSLVVRSTNGQISPFSRDKLFLSVFQAVGHRKQSIDDASALTATITAKLLQNAQAALNRSDIVKTALEVLKRFDKAAAVQYEAYHKVAR